MVKKNRLPCKWKISKFPSGKTQAHTCGRHLVIWKNKGYCVRSGYVKLKDKCFTNLPKAKKYVKNYFKD